MLLEVFSPSQDASVATGTLEYIRGISTVTEIVTLPNEVLNAGGAPRINDDITTVGLSTVTVVENSGPGSVVTVSFSLDSSSSTPQFSVATSSIPEIALTTANATDALSANVTTLPGNTSVALSFNTDASTPADVASKSGETGSEPTGSSTKTGAAELSTPIERSLMAMIIGFLVALVL